MNTKLFLSGILALSLLSACGYKEGVVTAAQKSNLFFSGNTANVLVSIDGGERFPVKNGRDNLYSIAPGKHRVLVYRNGNVIAERDVLVSDGVSKEIEVK